MSLSTTAVTSSISSSLSSAGLGSGLDVSTIVSSLVTAETSGKETRLTAALTSDQSTISTLGSLKSKLASLKTAVQAFTKNKALGQLTASSSSTSTLTATASTNAVAGNYSVKVTSLAAANSTMSAAYASSSTDVGTGTLTIKAGGSSFDVTLASGASTLADLRDAINNSTSNTGVKAAIITGTDGAHLLLSATSTGTANAVSVDTNSLINFTEQTTASNAKITVSGVDYEGSSNTISDAIQGVTLSLVAKSDTTATISVSANSSSATTAAQTLVDTYNSIFSSLKSEVEYDTTTKTAGSLYGNTSMMALSQQLATVVNQQLTTAIAGISSLSNIGFSVADDGTMSLDTTTFQNSFNKSPTAMQALLANSGGVGDALDQLVSRYADTGGLMDAQTDGLQNVITDINSQLTTLDARKATLTARYTQQFSAIDASVSKYNSVSSFLTQNFAVKDSNN